MTITQTILKAGVELGEAMHYRAITRREIAEIAGVSLNDFTCIFGSMIEFHRAVIIYAADNGHHRIVAQAIAVRDPMAVNIPAESRRLALNGLT